MKITVSYRYEINGKAVEQTATAEFNDNRGISNLIDRDQRLVDPAELAKERARQLFDSFVKLHP